MSENHLTYFKIENFKRFDSFEMENLGQYNLLVGDNNVGKTSVLEGLLFDEDRINFLSNYTSILYSRNLLQDLSISVGEKFFSQQSAWKYIVKDLSKPLLINVSNNQSLKLVFIKEIQLEKFDKNFIAANLIPNKSPELWIRFYKNEEYLGTFGRYAEEIVTFNSLPESPKINFLGLNVEYNQRHTEEYYSIINSSNSNRNIFDFELKTIIPNLIETRPHKVFEQEVIGVVLKNNNEIVPVTVFGDGVIKIMRVLLGIIGAKGKRLMIDEIETGIHFSRLKDYWKTVITLCKKYDVQLFATTHSLECQKYFVYALAELEEEDRNNARNVSLVEDSEGQVKSVTFDFKQFEFAMEIGYNTRGGF